jgi:hypothetical protein
MSCFFEKLSRVTMKYMQITSDSLKLAATPSDRAMTSFGRWALRLSSDSFVWQLMPFCYRSASFKEASAAMASTSGFRVCESG